MDTKAESELTGSSVKVRFRLAQDEDGYPPFAVESLWTLKQLDGYEIDNIPFYLKEFALGDVISAEAGEDGNMWCTGLVRASGHSTIQILFATENDVPSIRKELKKIGCGSEGSNIPRLIAVDVPPNVPYDVVKAFLDQGETAGTFEYQEACLGFMLAPRQTAKRLRIPNLDGPETAAFICSHVFEKTSPVLFVCRTDGDWQLLCGGVHDAGELPRLVGLNHLLDDDASLCEILDLPVDWEAERTAVGALWIRRRASPEE